MNPANRICELNMLYADMIKNILDRLPELKPDLGPNQLLLLSKGMNSLIIPTDNSWSTPFGIKLRQAREEVLAWWIIHEAEYIKLVRALDGIGIYSNPIPKMSFLLYFDYFVIDDLMLTSPTHPEEWKNSYFTAGILYYFRSLIPLLNIKNETDLPMIVLLPPPHSIDTDLEQLYHEAYLGKFSDPMTNIAENNTLSYLKNISKVDLPFKSTLQIRRLGDKGDINIGKLFYLEEIKKFFGFKNYQKCPVLGAEEFWDALQGKQNWVGGNTFKWMIKFIFNDFFEIARADIASISTQSVVLGINQRAYEEKLKIEGLKGATLLGLSEEKFTAISLSSPSFVFLENISIEDIIKIRNKGGVSVLRKIFGSVRYMLRSANDENINEIMKECSNRLQKAQKEYWNGIEKICQDIKKLEVELMSSGIITVSTCAINIISIPYPYLAAVTIPASFLIGGPSIYSMIKKKRKKKHLQECLLKMQQRPIALFPKFKSAKHITDG